MAIETNASKVVEVEIPPPFVDEKPKDWRNPPPPLPFGHQLLNQVDPSRTSLYPDQQRNILAIESEEALKEMLYADLGDTLTPDIMTAEKVFGKVLMSNLEIPSLLMTWKFYTLAQCMLAVDDGRKLASDPALTGPERVKGYQIQMEAVRGLIQITDRITKLAVRMGAIKTSGKKKKAVKETRVLRAAPTLSQESQA